MRAAHAAYYLALGDAIDRQIRTRQETMQDDYVHGRTQQPAGGACLGIAARSGPLPRAGRTTGRICEHVSTCTLKPGIGWSVCWRRVQPQNTRPYAHAARRMAAVLWMQEDLHAAEAWITASIECWRQHWRRYSNLALLLLFWALILLHRDEYEAALVPAREAAALVRLEPTMHWLPISLFTLGRISCALGDYGAATTLTEEGLALFRRREDRWGEALGVICMADVPYAQGDYAAARPQYAEALQELQGVINAPWLVTRVALSLGKSLWHLEEPEAAAEHWRESIAVGRAIGARKYVAGSLLMLGLAAQQTGDADRGAPVVQRKPWHLSPDPT